MVTDSAVRRRLQHLRSQPSRRRSGDERVTRFITGKLRLKVNESKSAVARPEERKFLGFSISKTAANGASRRSRVTVQGAYPGTDVPDAGGEFGADGR